MTTLHPAHVERLLGGIALHWNQPPTIGAPFCLEVCDAATTIAVWRQLTIYSERAIDIVLALSSCGEGWSLPTRATVAALATRRGQPTLLEVRNLAHELTQLRGPQADLARRLWLALGPAREDRA